MSRTSLKILAAIEALFAVGYLASEEDTTEITSLEPGSFINLKGDVKGFVHRANRGKKGVQIVIHTEEGESATRHIPHRVLRRYEVPS